MNYYKHAAYFLINKRLWDFPHPKMLKQTG